MSDLYDTLGSIGYKRNNKPILHSTTAEFNHNSQIDDSQHLEALNGAMEKHGYRHIPQGVLPTWVKHDNDDDAISLHHKAKGEGHRLFHMTDNVSESLEEGFEILVQHPTGLGHIARVAAKTNNAARDMIDNLKSKYPKHHIMVRNKHTGLSQIYRPHKEVTEKTKMKTLTQMFEAKWPKEKPIRNVPSIDKYTGDSDEHFDTAKKVYPNDKATQHWLAYRNHTTDGNKERAEFHRQKALSMKESLMESWGTLSREAKDLVLHADNSRDLHRQSKAPIVQNLAKKMQKGTYDHERAKKLWAYHADRAAHSFSQQSGSSTPWHKQFSTGVRKEAATYWADAHRDGLKDAT
jgi:hypothetical protein